jgi:hypothetical protein
MWTVQPEQGRLYVATFAPKRLRKLFQEARKFVGRDIYVTPVYIIDTVESSKYAGQWVFRCNEMSLLILEQDLVYIKEVTHALETEKASPDQSTK